MNPSISVEVKQARNGSHCFRDCHGLGFGVIDGLLDAFLCFCLDLDLYEPMERLAGKTGEVLQREWTYFKMAISLGDGNSVSVDAW